MFKKLRKPNSEGFTIIEVMIVLAIAALILLIVLLAVPALQRNSRNTGIKSSVGNVSGGINTFESDNNGLAPNYVSGTGSIIIGTGTTTCTAPGAGAASETINVSGTPVSCNTSVPTAQIPAGTVYVMPLNACPAAVAATGTPAAPTSSARSVAIYYSIETSGGLTNQCTST